MNEPRSQFTVGTFQFTTLFHVQLVFSAVQ